jgi:phage terminase large subunit
MIHSGAERDPAKWYSLMLRADDSHFIAEGELDDARAQMTPEQYAQEYLCSFDAAVLGAYYGKIIAEIERAGHITEVPKVADVPVQTAWDLGISANGMMAIWVFQVVAGEIMVLDFIGNYGQQLDFQVDWLEERYPRASTDRVDWLPDRRDRV